MLSRVLLPIDDSAASMRAIDCAINLVEGTDTTLVVMSVVGKAAGWVSAPVAGVAYVLEEATGSQERERQALLNHALGRMPESVNCMKLLTAGEPGAEILNQLAAGDYDMVVLGAQRRHAVGAAVLGSVSRHVLRETAVPVMIVRATEGYEDWTPPPVTGPDAESSPEDDA